jgi:hypothetical protein
MYPYHKKPLRPRHPCMSKHAKVRFTLSYRLDMHVFTDQAPSNITLHFTREDVFAQRSRIPSEAAVSNTKQ